MKNIINRTIKYSLVAVLLSVFTLKAGAQKAEFGLRFMPTFSKFDVQTSSGGKISGEATFGLGVGLLLGFNITNHVGIQGELIYSSASQKYREEDIERHIKLSYLNIPLLISLNTGKTKAINLNVVAGPQIGISVGSRLRTTSDSGSGSPNAVLSVKKGDLGFAYGAGIDFGLNPNRNIRLGLGYRGVRGLFDISGNSKTIANDSYYVLGRSHVKSNAIYAGLSILF